MYTYIVELIISTDVAGRTKKIMEEMHEEEDLQWPSSAFTYKTAKKFGDDLYILEVFCQGTDFFPVSFINCLLCARERIQEEVCDTILEKKKKRIKGFDESD